MANNTPEEAVARVDEALNEGDIEAILDFYEDGAVMVAEPGRIVQGKANMRETFEAILRLKGVARQLKTHVIEAGDLALLSPSGVFPGKLPTELPFRESPLRRLCFANKAMGSGGV